MNESLKTRAENNKMSVHEAFEIIEKHCLCSEPNCKTTGNCKFKHINGVLGSCAVVSILEIVKNELEGKAPRGTWEPANVDHRGYTNHFICTHCKRDVYLTKYCAANDEFESCPHCRAIMDL